MSRALLQVFAIFTIYTHFLCMHNVIVVRMTFITNLVSVVQVHVGRYW